MPWGTITALIHETEGGDLGNRIENGRYECEYEMLNYNTFRLESCENLINYEATATYPFTIPAGLNLSRALYAHLSFDGPGDSGGGTNIPSCANVRGWNCEEPVYYVNGVEMTDWFGAYGPTPRFGWIDPAILHEGSNQLTITSKPLWSNIWIDGNPSGPFYTGRVDIDDVYVTIQTSYSPSEMPELLNVTINPDILLTTHDITISPVIKPGSPDWEIVGISYYVFDTKTGDMDLHRVLPDTGNLTYRPAPGNYGQKWLKAKMHVQERLTGHREISEVTLPLTIYFEKGQYPNWVDDNADQLPNWFEYWMDDGAVPGLAPPVKYGPNMPGYGVSTAAGEVAVFPLAATIHYPAPLVIPSTNHNPAGESFGGPDVEGIDCVAEVIAHENYHKWVNEQWLAGGSFAGKADSDYYVLGNKTYNDKLPDDYENTVSLTFDSDTDSYLLGLLKHPQYEYYGDNEYMAMRAGNTGRGIPTNDWAYPGKQANGSVVTGVLNPPAAAACAGGMCDIIAQSPAIGMTENPQDTNANGKYDLLDAGNDITIDWPGMYDTVAILSGDQGSGPDVITTLRNRTSFASGTFTYTASFQGTAISSYGIDGPYNVTLLLKHDMNENGEPSSVSWETAAYSSTDFEPVSVAFDGTATASLLDRDLSVTVPLLINTAGEYTIEGYLQDPDGKKIAHAQETSTFSAGAANADLVFDGNAIAAHHRDGTYTMVNFRILDSTGTTVSRLTSAGTVTIDSSDFGTLATILTDSYSASGDQQNSDGRYETLLFTAEITVPAEARYFYSASLFDEQGGEVQTIDGQVPTIQGEIGELSPGVQTLKARFSGADIYANRVNGTFSVRSLEVNGPPGSDIRSRPLTTVSFNYTDFASPPVMITGNVTDYPVDYNSDGMYDAIRIGFDVETGSFSSGTATIPLLGELTVQGANQTGVVHNVIASSLTNNPQLDQQMTHHVTLDFAGTDINGMGIDGPYDLTLLQAGKTSSGITPYYYPESYATADYDHTQFGPAALLMGTISDDIGRPLESVTISAGGKTTTTNDAGFYRFYYATGGSTQVLVTPPPALNFSSDFRSVSFSTGSTTYANFSLFRPVAIHGTVTAENGTIITEGAIIAEGPTTSVFQLDSWGNGSYRISGQRNGTYDIRYTRVGGSDVIAAPLKDTYLTPGQSYEWDVVAYQRRSISGTVTDIYGDPLDESAVSITDGPITRTWPSNAETDASGVYSFLNLVPGNYTLEAEPPWLLRNDLIANTTSVTIGISDSTVTKNIVLMPEPAEPVVGDFISCDPGGGPPPLTVSFEDRASGYPTAWLWDFGDGDTSTERRPVHTYTDYGVYNITLTVSNDYGSNTSYFEEWIWVEDPPAPRIILPTGTLGAGGSGTFMLAATEILSSDMADDIQLTLRFDPSVVQLDEVAWNSSFSGETLTADIDNSTGEAEIYIKFWGWPDFMEPTDLVDLHFTATGAPGANSLLTADPATWQNCYDGCISSPLAVTNGSITVDGGGSGAVPVPGFSSNTTSGSLPLPVAFDSSLSDAFSPTAYLWTFGDGNSSALANPTHTYEIAGTYDVALQVTNSSGTNTTTMTGFITVSSPPSPVIPVPVISADTTAGNAPLTVQFSSADSIVASPTAYLWTFGDGNTSVLANPEFTYSIPGTYDVALQVTNSSGTNTTTMTSYITVSSPPSPVLPIPVITADTTTGNAPLNVQFSSADSIVTMPTAYLWTFGDGNTSVQANPSHSYAVAGTYDVALSITNSSGTNVTTMNGYITASPAPSGALPLPAFTADTTSGAVPLTVQFSSAPSDVVSPTGYLWNFGDGSTSVLENPSHEYTAVGLYDVSFRITNSSGFNTTTRTGYISTHSTTGNSATLPSGSTLTGNQISVNLTGAGGAEQNGDQIILNNQGGFDQIIFSTSGVSNTTGNLTGTITGILLVTPVMTASIPEGTATLQANISASAYDSGGDISFTFMGANESLNTAYGSLLGSRMNETALVFEITATGMNSITGSVLTITVPDAFRERNSGGIAVVWTHGGTSTVLTATYLGSSGGVSTYQITVPGGFSTFGVVGLGTATTSSPPAASALSSVSSSYLTSTSDSSPVSKAEPVPGTQTANVGGSSAIRQVTVTGTGVRDIIVTAYSRWGPTAGIPELDFPVYQYVEINPARYTTITSATIQFSVSQAWADGQGITRDDIVLHHYTAGSWQSLPTTWVKTENGQMFFSAESSGFSLFAIAARNPAVNERVLDSHSSETFGELAGSPEPAQVSPAGPGQAPAPAKTTAVPAREDTVPGFMVPVIIAGILGAILICGVVLVRRWWIRRQNPALFREYD
jgi:PKD repeat protein